jgi:hypothetical protein
VSDIEKLQEEHTNFAHQKCLTYVPNPQCLQFLNEFIQAPKNRDNNGHGKYLMIIGPSGSGKSSLVANWWQVSKGIIFHFCILGILYLIFCVLTFKILAQLETPIFVHFVGSSAFASDFVSMILRLFKEINSIVVSYGGTALEIPTTENAIVEHISIFFQLIAKYKVSTFYL